MRCPKCHYISFESADRCRNCGYDYSLADTPAAPEELPLNDRDEDPLPPVDLSLSQVDGLREAREPETPAAFDIDRIHARGAATPVDLPLFKNSTAPAREPAPSVRSRAVPAVDEDAPLVKPSAVPRAPIAVRRPTPDAQRLRARYPLAEVPRLALESPVAVNVDSEPDVEPDVEIDVSAPSPVPDGAPAPAGRRLLAGAIDLAIIVGIDVGVLYFTLKLCDLPLTFQGVLALPLVPLLVFLLMLDAGYAITFTAVVGQTIGKMATGLRVVHVTEDNHDDDQPNFGFAILRTAAYAASLLPAGLGFVPALLGKDRRALHDRLAETRVVRWGPVVKS